MCSPKTDRAMAVQKNMSKTSNFNSCTLRSEDSGIHLNGTFFPWKTLNITEINRNIEKLCNKNLEHFPVGLVSIVRKLWEEKPVKKRLWNNSSVLLRNHTNNQINVLARQMYPGNIKYFMGCFKNRKSRMDISLLIIKPRHQMLIASEPICRLGFIETYRF